MALDTMPQMERPSLAGLLTGLVDEVKKLVQQELRLVRDEIRVELGKAQRGVVSMAIGIGCLAVGALLLILMLVHLVQFLTQWPLWVCYGLVGVVLLAAGAWLAMKGQRAVKDVHAMPIQTVQSIKEDARWIKEQVASTRT